jgi:O-antigen ligase
MNPLLAAIFYACLIAGLFYLDRDSTIYTSRALWLPVIWISIIGSRSVSAWFGVSDAGASSQLDGSPVDAAVYAVLSAAAIAVLVRRSNRTCTLLAANWPILAYFLYCLISTTWSYHPDVSFKRWIKAVGDLAMVLVITTEPRLRDALIRLFSRIGFLLLPTSVLLIKYYWLLGRAFTPDGLSMNTGVTTNKNSLGVTLLVVSLGTLWRVLALVREKTKPNRRRQLLAQGSLLALGILLFKMADSATSTACFLLGSAIILMTNVRAIGSRPARAHLFCLGIVLAGAFIMLFGGQSLATKALGRKSDFSGRTVIWAAVIRAAGNPLIGTGFESFWISPNEMEFERSLVGWWHPENLNEAHDGYLEVYLELGWVGVSLISLILITGYARAVAMLRQNPSMGGLMLAYIICGAVYSITEAGFRELTVEWIFLLLAVVAASSNQIPAKKASRAVSYGLTQFEVTRANSFR